MPQAETYKRYAAECIELAHRLTDQVAKLTMLEMAEAWNRLALRAESHDRNGHTPPES
jgi:hypothetical protein